MSSYLSTAPLEPSGPRPSTTAGLWRGRTPRAASTWVAPGVLAVVVGVFLLVTPLTWTDVGGVLPPGADTWRVAFGDAFVPGVALLVTFPMGLCSVAAVALARVRPLLATALVALPASSVAVTGLFFWGWWLAALFVAALLAAVSLRLAWPAVVIVVAVAVWYCVSGAAALLPIGAVTAASDDTVRTTSLVLYLAAVAIVVGGAWLAGAALRWQRRVRARAGEAETSAREATAAEAVTSERARAARDLHDVVAHHVSLVAVRAESAPYVHPELDATAREVLGDIATDARGALHELRHVLTILQRAGHEDAPLRPQPGSADVATLVADARAAGQDVVLAGAVPDLPAAPGYVVYRAVQEALTNARRHAPGKPVRVEVEVRSDAVGVRVANPFPGATRGVPTAGRGLLGMRERAEALGGVVRHAVDDGAFVLDVSLPLGPGEAAR